MTFRYFNFKKCLDIITSYMIVGAGTITVFADIAINKKWSMLAYGLNFTYIICIFLLAITIFYWTVLKGKNLIETLAILVIICISSVLFFVIYPQFSDVWNYFIFRRFLKHGLILFLLLRLKPNYNKILKYCQTISRIAIVVLAVILFFTDWFDQDYLAVSDNLSMAVMILFGSAICRGNVIDYFIGIIGAIAMLLFGDRAHIVCILFVLFLWIVKKNPQNNYLRNFKIFCLLFIIVLFIIFITRGNTVLNMIQYILSDLGIDSRNITYILDARISDSSGRNIFYENIWNAVQKNPLGYGILGDVILNYNNGITDIITGAYSHNGYLQAICEFGILGGTVLWLWIIVNGIKTFRSSSEAALMIFLIAFCGSGVIILAFSYSYWISTPFWGFIALLLNERKRE